MKSLHPIKFDGRFFRGVREARMASAVSSFEPTEPFRKVGPLRFSSLLLNLELDSLEPLER